MRMRRLAAFLLALVAAGARPEAQAAPSDPAWTLLFFVNADCEAGASINNLIEGLAEHGATPQVEVLVYVDQGGPCSVVGEPPTSAGQLLRVHRGSVEVLPEAPPPAPAALAAGGTAPNDPNMGDSGLLAWFLQMGLGYAGSGQVALFTVGHGSPWSGLGADATNSDNLEFWEYGDALASVLNPARRQLDLLGLLHCELACLEGVCALAPHAKYMLASESMTDLMAIDPGDLLRRLHALLRQSPVAALDLANLCLDLYRVSALGSGGAADGITLVHCGQWPASMQAFSALATELRGALSTGSQTVRSELRLAFRRARPFFCCSTTGCGAGCHPCKCAQRDALQIAETLGRESSHPGVAAAARCLACRLLELAPGLVAGPWEVGIGGLSVFAPCKQRDIVHYQTSPLANQTPWLSMLEECLGDDCEVVTAEYFTTTGLKASWSPDGAIELTGVVGMQHTPGDEAWLVVTDLRGEPWLTVPAQVTASPAGSRLRARWDGTLPFLDGALTPLRLPIIQPRALAEKDGRHAGETVLRWTRQGDDGRVDADVFAQYVVDFTTSPARGFMHRLRPGPQARMSAVITLEPGDRFQQPLPPGVEVPPPTPPTTITAVPAPIRFERVAPGRGVGLGFVLNDRAGRTHTALLATVSSGGDLAPLPAPTPMGSLLVPAKADAPPK